MKYVPPCYSEFELPLLVETWSVASDEKINYRVIDHANHDHRVWLGKHCFWAFRNGHGVVTKPLIKETPPMIIGFGLASIATEGYEAVTSGLKGDLKS